MIADIGSQIPGWVAVAVIAVILIVASTHKGK